MPSASNAIVIFLLMVSSSRPVAVDFVAVAAPPVAGSAAPHGGRPRLDQVSEPLALRLLEHRVDLAERADRSTAQRLDRGVVPREQLSEARLVEARAPDSGGDIGARRAHLAALRPCRFAQLLERV